MKPHRRRRSYEINGGAVGDSWKKIQVWFNGSNTERTVHLLDASWKKTIENNLFVARPLPEYCC